MNPDISLRDIFALKAMDGVCNYTDEAEVVRFVYRLADAMLAEREKKMPKLEPDSPKEREALTECNLRLHANEKLLDQLVSLSEKRDALKHSLNCTRIRLEAEQMRLIEIVAKRDKLSVACSTAAVIFRESARTESARQSFDKARIDDINASALEKVVLECGA